MVAHRLRLGRKYVRSGTSYRRATADTVSCCCQPLSACCLNRPIRVDFTSTGLPFAGVRELDCAAALLFGQTFDWGFLSGGGTAPGVTRCYYGGDDPVTPFACVDGISIIGIYMEVYHRWTALPGPGPTPGVVEVEAFIWITYQYPGSPVPTFGTLILRDGSFTAFPASSRTQLLESQYCVDVGLTTAALTEAIEDFEFNYFDSFGAGPVDGFLTGPIRLIVP